VTAASPSSCHFGSLFDLFSVYSNLRARVLVQHKGENVQKGQMWELMQQT
jgi:hypothetical protein